MEDSRNSLVLVKRGQIPLLQEVLPDDHAMPHVQFVPYRFASGMMCSPTELCPAIGATWDQVYSGGPPLNQHQLSPWPEDPKEQGPCQSCSLHSRSVCNSDFWHIISAQNIFEEYK